MTTRDEILARGRDYAADNEVEYSMDPPFWKGFRRDCSGFVSYVLGLVATVAGGLNTATLVTTGTITRIAAAILTPGDLVGICGPGTEGPRGHVRLFIGWYNDDPDDNRYYGREMAGGLGPDTRVFDDLADAGNGDYVAYRYTGLTDPPPAPPPVEPAPPVVNTGEYPDGDYVTVVPYQDPPDGPAWNSTLSGIAEHTGTTVFALAELNPDITDVDLIYPGQRVRIR